MKHVLSIIAVLAMTTLPALAQNATAVIDRKAVFIGESFTLQIQVEGGRPNTPDMSIVKDFVVQSRGSSTQTSFGMGRSSQMVILNYSLSPKKVGTLMIPAITVIVNSKRIKTDPIVIRVSPPSDRKDMKLQQILSVNTAYPGQPITLTFRWLTNPAVTGQVDFGNANIQVPAFGTEDFDFIKEELKQRPRNEIVTVGGKRYDSRTFVFTLFPKTLGTIELPSALVNCSIIKGYTRRRETNSLFFGGGRQAVKESASIQSNAPKLVVKPLPTTGKPPSFNGLIGNYRIITRASPLDVNVGDPIQLKLSIGGPHYLGNVKLPALDKQPKLTQGFKLPTEFGKGKRTDGFITYELTVRAKHADVTEIPAIELPYFDTGTGKYSIAKSRPIQIKVRATRVVTADDAEGREITPSSSTKSKLESVTAGIGYNYGPDQCLSSDATLAARSFFATLAGMALLSVPPLIWMMAFVSAGVIRKRLADPDAVKARHAYGKLSTALKSVTNQEDLLESAKRYLGAKLRIPPGALTFADIETGLESTEVDDDALTKLKRIFDTGEAARFAGGGSDSDLADDVRALQEAVATLEKLRIGK